MYQFVPFFAVHFKFSNLKQIYLSFLFVGFWQTLLLPPPPQSKGTCSEKNLKGFFRAVVLDRRRKNFFPKIHCFSKFSDENVSKKRIFINRKIEKMISEVLKKSDVFEGRKINFSWRKQQIIPLSMREGEFYFQTRLAWRWGQLLRWPLIFSPYLIFEVDTPILFLSNFVFWH